MGKPPSSHGTLSFTTWIRLLGLGVCITAGVAVGLIVIWGGGTSGSWTVTLGGGITPNEPSNSFFQKVTAGDASSISPTFSGDIV